MITTAQIADQLIDTDALVPSDSEVLHPDYYVVEAVNLGHLVETILLLARGPEHEGGTAHGASVTVPGGLTGTAYPATTVTEHHIEPDVGDSRQGLREQIAELLYVQQHGEWISGTPRTPNGTRALVTYPMAF